MKRYSSYTHQFRNPECRRFASSKPSSPRSPLFAIDILSVHYEKVLQSSPIHAPAVVGDDDLFFLTIECHFDDWVRAWVDVLKPVGHIFPNYQFVGFEKPRALQKVAGDMTLDVDLI